MRALITGVTGQDGSYLAQQLADAGWQVSGMTRINDPQADWAAQLVPGMQLVAGDLSEPFSLRSALAVSLPDVVFNMAAMSNVRESWQHPLLAGELTGMGAARMLEATRVFNPEIRFIQASSSDVFQNTWRADESSPMLPRSPYGAAKLFAHHHVALARDVHGMHASNAIMFNHESPRRAPQFVSRKIACAVARIARGQQEKLALGPVSSRRDWGWAPEFTRALHLMAQAESPGDYVIATGTSHTVGELAEAMFAAAGLDAENHITVNPAFHRPNDMDSMGLPGKAKEIFGWQHNVSFTDLARLMVEAEL
jgi:GDPmannose 4,6-dehydratase